MHIQVNHKFTKTTLKVTHKDYAVILRCSISLVYHSWVVSGIYHKTFKQTLMFSYCILYKHMENYFVKDEDYTWDMARVSTIPLSIR